jgi:ATP-binding cassette subfamily B protein
VQFARDGSSSKTAASTRLMSSRAKQGLPALLPVLRLLAQYKLRLAGASIALLFTAGATLSLGRGLQVLIDQGFGGDSSGDLKNAIALLVAIAAAMAFGTFIRF